MLARLLALLLTLAPLPAGAAERIVVFAAASLATAMDAAAAGWRAAGGAELVLSYAGTPALARQIEAGAPADIFVSASADWMDVLAARGLVRGATRRDLFGNRLVLVAPAEAAGAAGGPVGEIGPGFDLSGRLGGGRLAMALVAAVPAGIYGREALVSLGLWEGVEGRLAEADNVRAALALVAAGEAPLGIVYATDARAEPRVTVIGRFPAASHAPIRYPAALLAASAHPGAAEFLDYLSGPAAQAVFAAAGFEPAGFGPTGSEQAGGP